MIENSVVAYDELGQGSFRKEISLKPIHYFKDGLWRPIVNVLNNSGDPNLTVGSNELFDFRIRNKLSGNAPLVHIGKGNQMIRYTPLDTANVAGIVYGNTVTYPEAWANADLKITLGGHIIRKDIILRRGHPQSFSFRIDDKSNMDDDLVGSEFYITRPFLYKEGKGSIYLDWAKTSQGGKIVLTTTLPEGSWEGWTLDPQYTSQPDETTGMDVEINRNSNRIDTDQATISNWSFMSWSEEQFYQGSLLIKFDLSTISAGSSITSATFEHSNFIAGDGYGNVLPYRCRRAWIESQAGWTQYSTGLSWGTAGCLNSTTDYDSTALSTGLDTAIGTKTKTFTASKIQEMIPGGTWTNNGFIISHSPQQDGGLYGMHMFTSGYAVASGRPKLTIVYTEGGGSTARNFGPAVQSM